MTMAPLADLLCEAEKKGTDTLQSMLRDVATARTPGDDGGTSAGELVVSEEEVAASAARVAAACAHIASRGEVPTIPKAAMADAGATTLAGGQGPAAPPWVYNPHSDNTLALGLDLSWPPALSSQRPFWGGEASAWSEEIDGGNLHCRAWPRAGVAAEGLWSESAAYDRYARGLAAVGGVGAAPPDAVHSPVPSFPAHEPRIQP